ncbi:hypothetical protein B6U84_01955 [Candidatus Bathyarchaeota archaeon ex4484_40]|nr:MAG: hypothetical protein B6U84_01955 [Candidatus Bathyarchaeota archaeon ex4484_40]
MTDIKKKINDLILEIERGNIDPKEAWRKIRELKNVYTKQYSEQSWHVYIGNKFQNIIYSTLKGYFNRLKRQDRKFENLSVLTQNEVEKNEIIHRKLAVKYGEYLLLPDADIVVVDYNFEDPWKSVILAIISCKTSLRERIAQSCYWKLKLLSSDITKNIRVFLATTELQL